VFTERHFEGFFGPQMKQIEQSAVGLLILKSLEDLAVKDPDTHRKLLGEIIAQAGRVNEPGYVSVVCPVLAETLKGAEIVPWLRRLQEQIAAGHNGDALETLGELEEWLSRLWQVADPFFDWSGQLPITTKSRRRRRLNGADVRFLKSMGVIAGNKRDESQPAPRRK
jgi:hypothetical protein